MWNISIHWVNNVGHLICLNNHVPQYRREERKVRGWKKRNKMQGYPLFLSQCIRLFLCLLGGPEKQTESEIKKTRETGLTHWWHYLHCWSPQISLSLTNTSTALLNTYTLSESFTLILTRPLSLSLALSLSVSRSL